MPGWKRRPSASGPASIASKPNWSINSATTRLASASSRGTASTVRFGQNAGSQAECSGARSVPRRTRATVRQLANGAGSGRLVEAGWNRDTRTRTGTTFEPSSRGRCADVCRRAAPSGVSRRLATWSGQVRAGTQAAEAAGVPIGTSTLGWAPRPTGRCDDARALRELTPAQPATVGEHRGVSRAARLRAGNRLGGDRLAPGVARRGAPGAGSQLPGESYIECAVAYAELIVTRSNLVARWPHPSPGLRQRCRRPDRG